MRELRVLLLGGAAGAGKSVSGGRVGRELGLPCISADSIWKAVQQATTRETHPAFHHFEPPPDVLARGPEHLTALHIEAAQALSPALAAFVDWELHDSHRFILEGAWITPEFAARRCSASQQERAVFIHEATEHEVIASMLARSRRTQPSERQLIIGGMSWRYGNWLKDSAEEYGLPVVAARPRETLVQRIIAASQLASSASPAGRQA